MPTQNVRIACLALLAALLVCAVSPRTFSQNGPQQGNTTQTPRPAQIPRLTIEVTGGENNVPVENASVYVKFVEPRWLRKDKKYELNVKTNREGIAHVPDPPLGKVLIQVIAEGWKTYGKWFEVTDQKQIIKVHLEKPHKWY